MKLPHFGLKDMEPSQRAALGAGGSLVGAVIVGLATHWVVGLLFLVVVALVVGLLWFLGRVTARRARYSVAIFDRSLTESGHAAEEFREDWKRACESLKEDGVDRNKLGFYVLIGEPKGGKSTMLRKSGINLPIGDAAIAGAAGTKNCDWWFTDQAIILDTAGRLAFHDQNPADAQSWQIFLKLLKQFKPHCPINGVLVTIPCDALLQDPPEEGERKAEVIRAALIELQRGLEVRFPVYLLLAKADFIDGFSEFFKHLKTTEQTQILGWSRPRERFEHPFQHGEIEGAFDEITARLRAYRTHLIERYRGMEAVDGAESVLQSIDRLIALPDEIDALRRPLDRYLETIFAPSKVLESLFFRGFFVTSSLQQGVTVMQTCASLFGSGGVQQGEALTQDRALFIRDFYRRKLFAEPGLVLPTRSRTPRVRLLRRASYAATAALAVVGTTLIGVSTSRIVDSAAEPEARLAAAVQFLHSNPSDENARIQGALSHLRYLHRLEDDGACGFLAEIVDGSALSSFTWMPVPMGRDELRRDLAAGYRTLFSQGLMQPLATLVNLALDDDRPPDSAERLEERQRALLTYAEILREGEPPASLQALSVVAGLAGMSDAIDAAYQSMRHLVKVERVELPLKAAFGSGNTLDDAPLLRLKKGIDWVAESWKRVFERDQGYDWGAANSYLAVLQWLDVVDKAGRLDRAILEAESGLTELAGHPCGRLSDWSDAASKWSVRFTSVVDTATALSATIQKREARGLAMQEFQKKWDYLFAALSALKLQSSAADKVTECRVDLEAAWKVVEGRLRRLDGTVLDPDSPEPSLLEPHRQQLIQLWQADLRVRAASEAVELSEGRVQTKTLLVDAEKVSLRNPPEAPTWLKRLAPGSIDPAPSSPTDVDTLIARVVRTRLAEQMRERWTPRLEERVGRASREGVAAAATMDRSAAGVPHLVAAGFRLEALGHFVADEKPEIGWLRSPTLTLLGDTKKGVSDLVRLRIEVYAAAYRDGWQAALFGEWNRNFEQLLENSPTWEGFVESAMRHPLLLGTDDRAGLPKRVRDSFQSLREAHSRLVDLEALAPSASQAVESALPSGHQEIESSLLSFFEAICAENDAIKKLDKPIAIGAAFPPSSQRKPFAARSDVWVKALGENLDRLRVHARSLAGKHARSALEAAWGEVRDAATGPPLRKGTSPMPMDQLNRVFGSNGSFARFESIAQKYFPELLDAKDRGVFADFEPNASWRSGAPSACERLRAIKSFLYEDGRPRKHKFSVQRTQYRRAFLVVGVSAPGGDAANSSTKMLLPVGTERTDRQYFTIETPETDSVLFFGVAGNRDLREFQEIESLRYPAHLAMWMLFAAHHASPGQQQIAATGKDERFTIFLAGSTFPGLPDLDWDR